MDNEPNWFDPFGKLRGYQFTRQYVYTSGWIGFIFCRVFIPVSGHVFARKQWVSWLILGLITDLIKDASNGHEHNMSPSINAVFKFIYISKFWNNKLTMQLFVLQYMTEKIGGVEGTKLDDDFMEMEKVT